MDFEHTINDINAKIQKFEYLKGTTSDGFKVQGYGAIIRGMNEVLDIVKLCEKMNNKLNER